MYELAQRRFIILAFIGLVFVIYISRLFYLQALSKDYSIRAERNAIEKITIEPSRGILYDRKGRLYVNNKPLFDLVVLPSELYIPDTTILERFLRLDRATIRQRLAEAFDPRIHNRFKPYVLERHLEANLCYQLQEQLHNFRGVNVMARSSRYYLQTVGANYLGYIREVSPMDLARNNGYYIQGDMIGTSGIEQYYEKDLRGRKGIRMVLKDNKQREIGSFEGGKYDTLPEKGRDIMLTIDTDLQRLGEELMYNKVGSIVAIEPRTGEILAFVAAPTYDPSLLTGMNFSANWNKLYRDTLKPLFNRPLMAPYPPGSIFKSACALIGLQEGIINQHTAYGCIGGFPRNKGRPRCHPHGSPLSVSGAIQTSCNAFFAGLYVDMLHHPKYDSVAGGLRRWDDYMTLFGVGHKLGVDIPSENKGRLPTPSYYNRVYGRRRWKGMTIVSNSIGQGEVNMTPLQMANMAAMIGNRGYYVQPHFFKSFYQSTDKKFNYQFEKVTVSIDTSYFRIVAEAMEQAVAAGTGYLAYTPEIRICGKTGTAQNPHGKDHSVFVAFAPIENPQIAIAVIVENAGWGGDWAAPIAGLMIQKHILGELKETENWKYDRIVKADFIRPRSYSLVRPDTSRH